MHCCWLRDDEIDGCAGPLNSTDDTPALASDVMFSVVVPVYSNESTLEEALERLTGLAETAGGRLEVVFVVDGSPDGSLALLQRLLPATPLASQLVVHSRNFGSFAAIRSGLEVARGRYIAVMAADLQEPIELIEEFFAALQGGADVAVGRRASRDDPMLSTAMSRSYWALYRWLINPAIPAGGIDVFACSREVANHLLALREANSSLVGLVYWVGFRRAEIPYERVKRTDGTSGWSLKRRVRYMLDSVFAFTDLPITVLIVLGLFGAAVTALMGAGVLVGSMAGRFTELGYLPLILVMLFCTSMVLLALGVVGAYIWRTFENTKGRPISIAKSREVFDAHQ
jgi:glycosyltransferase involved in cell wall biosynthesis